MRMMGTPGPTPGMASSAQRSSSSTRCVPAPNFFESIGIAFDRFMRGFSGEDKTATSQLLNTTPLIVDKTASTQ